jgi:hypothetical protein
VSAKPQENHHPLNYKEPEILTTLELDAGQKMINLQLKLVEAPEGMGGNLTIAGRVTNTSGKPITNARVSLQHTEFRHTDETDDRGYYRFENLTEGEFYVLITHPKYTKETLSNILAGTTDANVVLQDRVTIEGQIFAEDTGKPIPHFEIFHQNTNWVNINADSNKYVHVHNEEGRFSFDDVDVGPLAVVVRAEGYPQKKFFGEALANQKNPPLRIELSRGGQITGQVLTDTGESVSGAILFIGKAPGKNDARFDQKIVARSDANAPSKLNASPKTQNSSRHYTQNTPPAARHKIPALRTGRLPEHSRNNRRQRLLPHPQSPAGRIQRLRLPQG